MPREPRQPPIQIPIERPRHERHANGRSSLLPLGKSWGEGMLGRLSISNRRLLAGFRLIGRTDPQFKMVRVFVGAMGKVALVDRQLGLDAGLPRQQTAGQ